METELATDLLIQRLITELDPEAVGAFIEIGLGSLNYSFSWARKAGFKCYGVEPLPTELLKQLAATQHVDLTEAAITDVSGEIPIHVGILDGFTIPDLSSLHADWWGGSKVTKLVPALTLMQYLDEKHLEAVSCLKIDTEGSEIAIISSLAGITESRLPKLVAFEYGGGGTRASELGGWKPNFFQGTLDCLSVLKRLGYGSLVILESSSIRCEVVDLQILSDMTALFPNTAEVGNIVCLRNGISMERVRSISRKMTPELVIASCRKSAVSWWLEFRWNFIVRPTSGIARRIRRFLPKAPKSS